MFHRNLILTPALSLALLSLWLLATPALALVLCVPQTGEGGLKAREECRPGEGQVEPADLGLGGTGVGLAVFDSVNRKVGDVISIGGRLNVPEVHLSIDDQSVIVQVLRTRIVGRIGGLLFQSNDCFGQAFVGFESRQILDFRTTLLPPSVVAPPGNTLYIPDLTAPPRATSIGSFLPQFEDDGSGPGVCELDGFTRTAVPAIPLVDLDTLFTPPFEVR